MDTVLFMKAIVTVLPPIRDKAAALAVPMVVIVPQFIRDVDGALAMSKMRMAFQCLPQKWAWSSAFAADLIIIM